MFPYNIFQSKVLVLYYKPIFSEIQKIDIVYTVSNENIDIDIRYAYSYDGVNWSPYYQDENKFLQEFSEIGYQFSQLFLKIRIETIIPQTVENLGSLQEDGKYVKDLFEIDKEYATIEEVLLIKNPNDIISIPDKVEFLNTDSITISPQKLWNPYQGMELAFDIYEKMSESVNQMFGHWVYYFRTEGNEAEKSITFKQYKLSNVVDMKLIKVLVPGNIFPSNRNIYSEWGIVLPDEFNLHIVIADFAKAFGYNTKPNEKDYMFMPISGKMYDINSCFEDKSFMQRAIKYDCILVKHEKQETIDTNGYDADSFIQYVMDANNETYSEAEQSVSSPEIMNLISVDAYRLNMHKDLKIVSNPLTIDGVDIFLNMYQLNTVKTESPCVQYSLKEYIFQNTSINFWLQQISKRSGKLIGINDISGNEFLTIELKRGKLQVKYSDSVLESQELPLGVMLACSISFSNQYGFVSLMIASYSENFTCLFDNYLSIQTYEKAAAKMSLFNASVLISNISVNKEVLESDNFLNKLCESLPVEETNIIFDKAVQPSGETEFSL